MRVYLESLGCKLNYSEIEALARHLQEAGHHIVREGEEADLCVVNTCFVTHVAARKTRQTIRHLRRSHPQARLVVTGCYAQVAPAELAALGVDLVVSNEEKDSLPRLILSPIPHPPSLIPHFRPEGRTRAFVKIQDGCDNHCTYCVIRLARGHQRSRPKAEVLAEIESFLDAGYKEIVLTGVHIGSYGRDSGEGTLPRSGTLWSLVEAILARQGDFRLRLSSIEPWDFDPARLHLWEDPRLCRHLHLPLQSGCDEVLSRMGRRGRTQDFAAVVEAARRAIPDLAVTTDVIVGFPGETDEEFAKSLRFAEEMAFARIHVFPFSARPGTPAAEMPNQISPQAIEERRQAMLELARKSSMRFREKFLGRTMAVLWEKRTLPQDSEPARGSAWSGLTDNYIRVEARCEEDLYNRITSVKLVALTERGMWGKNAG
ncbi:MAG: tRNA (N(6)-L-threonylcarbamoyladenosine(37)-C(2))-methylthiotransferase MtaB [Anaerolineae bacterium]